MARQYLTQKLQGFKTFFGADQTDKRGLLWSRVKAQHFHGSALPLEDDISGINIIKAEPPVIQTFQSFEPNFATNLPNFSARVSNKQVRNKLLRTALSWGCQAIATDNERESGRRTGWIGHMAGDVYSASHVQRANVGEDARGQCANCCQVDKIQVLFSMDVVDWAKHVDADSDTQNWRFKCYSSKLAVVYKIIAEARKIYQAAVPTAKKNLANDFAQKFSTAFCDMLRFDDNLLNAPAGGASSTYSSYQNKHQPIFPTALTAVKFFEDYITKADSKLKSDGGFWYPSRNSGDYCSTPALMTCNPKVDLFLNAENQFDKAQSAAAITAGLNYQPARSSEDFPAGAEYTFKK
jgi:hypothetical protein